jgi:hypothetical protein
MFENLPPEKASLSLERSKEVAQPATHKTRKKQEQDTDLFLQNKNKTQTSFYHLR